MKKLSLFVLLAGAIAVSAQAQGISAPQMDVMKQLVAKYAEQVKAGIAKEKRQATPADEFSVESGRQIYLMSRNWEGDEMPACSGCHTDDPKKEGKHAETKKPIKPLAPAVNPERFTDAKKVETNFAKHCRDLYNRDCSAIEKGHFITYLMSVK